MCPGAPWKDSEAHGPCLGCLSMHKIKVTGLKGNQLFYSVQAAVTKYNRLGGLDNRHICSRSSDAANMSSMPIFLDL